METTIEKEVRKFNYSDKSKVEQDLGEVCGPGIMFFHSGVGSGNSGENEYELLSMMNGAPAIQSKQTGRTYVFDWEKLLRHAVDHGLIDDPSPTH